MGLILVKSCFVFVTHFTVLNQRKFWQEVEEAASKNLRECRGVRECGGLSQ